MFCAHCAPSYEKMQRVMDKVQFANVCLDLLRAEGARMHAATRKLITSALMLLRNRNHLPAAPTLVWPVYFGLWKLEDKSLRKQLTQHMIRDIMRVSRLTKSPAVHKPLQTLLLTQVHGAESSPSGARRAAAVITSLFRKMIWRDARVVNELVILLRNMRIEYQPAAKHVVLFMLSQWDAVDELQSSDDESDEDDGPKKAIIGSKKTKAKELKLKKAKKAHAKAKARKEAREGMVARGFDFTAIDLLHAPQDVADVVLARSLRTGESFKFRLQLLHLASRIIGRHRLVVTSFFPGLMRYVKPTQKDITTILAAAAQACHEDWPPEEVTPMLQHICKQFVNESQKGPVITVGLHAMREMALRCPAAMDEEMLGIIGDFLAIKAGGGATIKDKGTVMAARGIVNFYRDEMPELLPKKLRG